MMVVFFINIPQSWFYTPDGCEYPFLGFFRPKKDTANQQEMP
jgi:hypothetical protein